MQILSSIGTALFTGAATIVMVLLLAATARRVLGVPVGWIRSILMTVFVVSLGSWGLTEGFQQLGVLEADGSLTVHPGVVLVIVVLAWAWSFVIGLGLLLVLELLVPTGSIPTPWRAVVELRRGSKDLWRYTQIMGIMIRHGLGGFFGRGARRRSHQRTTDSEERAVARELRAALSDAGVTFVKLGQMLSTRADLLPAVYVEELSRLQSQVPPAPWPHIEAMVTRSIGAPVDTVFAYFDPDPIASASVGQVHCATLLDGREVVVKVQRPGARQQVLGDLRIVLRIARRLQRDTSWGPSLGIMDLAEGFAASLREELDYTTELENTLNVQGALATIRRSKRHPLPGAHQVEDPDANVPLVEIPYVHPELSSSTLLVMDRLDGTPVGDAADLLATFDDDTRHDIAARLLRVTLDQIVVTGVFHADLHPGNVFLRDDGSLGLLDFGSVGRLDEAERVALAAVLLAVEADDSIAATDALIELLDQPDSFDERRFERSVGRLILRFRGGGAASSGSLFAAMVRLVNDAGMGVPPQVAAAFRTIAALDGTLHLLSPSFELVSSARDEGEELLRNMVSLRKIRAKAGSQLLAFAPSIERLPRRLNKITSDLEAGRFTVNVRAFADPGDRKFVTSLVQQVISTIIAAASVVGGVFLLIAENGPQLTNDLSWYSVFGAVMLFIGAVLSIRVLIYAFRGAPADRGW